MRSKDRCTTLSAPSPNRSTLNEGILVRLAESGALECFKPERRDALWETLGVDRAENPGLTLESTEPAVAFPLLDAFETIGWDYAFSGHSARGHPLSPLREELTRMKLPDAAALHHMENGSRVRYAGLVICRQRPGTAKGVVFMTLEDETGFVNLVIWEKVFQRYEILAKTASFLGVTGKLQVQAGVTHLVAEQLWVPEVNTQPARRRSRDFH